MRLLSRLILPIVFVGVGFVLGGKYGAPAWVINAYDNATSFGADKAREVADDVADDLKQVDVEQVAGDMRDRAGRRADSVRGAVDELLKKFNETHEEDPSSESRADAAGAPSSQPAQSAQPTPPRAAPVAPAPSPSGDKAPAAPVRTADASASMKLCLSSISNAPPADPDGTIRNFKKLINVDGVTMLLAPVTNACLSSGYGPRGSSGRIHMGVDYYSKTGGDVLAAADGVIVEAVYRDDYGYMIVIDHGNGVYTRYAHLKRFERGVKEGRSVKRGQVIGPIGQSGAYTSIVHLHFEILRGDINAGGGSFGLTTVDPYTFPKA